MAPGTARKPAARKRASSQPRNLESTLSHHTAPPGASAMIFMSFRRKDSSTAFFSHSWTIHSPPDFSATRNVPSSRPASAASTASRASPWLAGPKLSRTSQAALMARARSLVMSNPDAVEEGTEIPGFMIDMGFGRNGNFRSLARPVALTVQPHGGHAQFVRHHQIAGDVVEHGGRAR